MAQKDHDWAGRAKSYLKAELKCADIIYEEFAKRLKKHGVDETEASVANKLARGTFSATSFLLRH